MLKLIYRLFKKQFLKFYYSEQPKKSGFENMEKHFVDSNGMQYYRAKNDFDIPILRFKEIQKRLLLLNSGLSEKSILMLCSEMTKAINGGKKPDVATVGFLIKEIERRANIYVDTDLLMDTACLLYIRQDENPSIIDWAIHKEKIDRLTVDSMGGLYDFFYMTGLTTYIPFVGTTAEEFNEFYKESELKMKGMQTFLKSLSIE